MASSPEIQARGSYATILEKQGFSPDLGPDDVTFEWAEFGRQGWANPSDRWGDWFAIPHEILAVNPFTGESEPGKLLSNGAFIGNDVDLGDRLHPSEFGTRAMVLGKSVVKEFCRIGEDSVLNNARVESGNIGNNTTVDAGTIIYGGRPYPRPSVGNNVTIGKNSYVSFKTQIGNDVTIGDNVYVSNSIVGDGVRVASGDITDEPHDYSEYRGNKTLIQGSRVAKLSRIATNATVENAIVGHQAYVGRKAVLENTQLVDRRTLRDGEIRRELREDGDGRDEVEARRTKERSGPVATATIRSGMRIPRPKMRWFGHS